MPLNDLHRALLNPASYPDESGPIEYRETHVSRLYLTPRHVYKVKKPVDFGFLNFTTLDRRRFYCQEEVRLNQRFCPDTYLGVVELRRQGNRIRVDGDGDIIDFAVKMNRLPENLMLDRLIEADASGLEAKMDRLGRSLARFHQESEIIRGEGGRSNLEVVRLNWQENFSQTEPFIGQSLCPQAQALCAGYVADFIEAHGPMMLRREQQGFVREGHGDLHAEHICMSDPVRVYDCIEFNQRFRIADVAADLAFLLMDLDFRGRRELSARLLQAYHETAGEAPELRTLLPFYQIYRAWVRGKVESFLAADQDAAPPTREAALAHARRYFTHALGYLGPPVLLLTCGLMGVGKTTLGAAVAGALGTSVLRSDVLRKGLAGISPEVHRADVFGKGIYSQAMTRRTYDHLLEQALDEVSTNGSALVDASFGRRSEREKFRRAAAAAGIPCLTLYMRCDRPTQLNRLVARQSQADASDGRPELRDRQEKHFESPEGETGLIVVDTAHDVDYNANLILAQILEKAGTRQ
ncbi:kinase [Desulfuromonas versatilis]|uniref:Kinase n=1 Tax=Desulfuromonas versatilis TaxID=2802975 RepID=A0ABM8HX86_9BACT|nr:AAA family ATPase [Desulfuromonas versatilis]BCR05407.1 kinase [Desulfuromonas versatilis]